MDHWGSKNKGSISLYLIYIILLLAIIILSAFIIFSYAPKGQPRSKSFRAEADIASIESAIAMYQTDMDGYFGDYSGAIGDINSPDPIYIGLVSPNDILKAQLNFKDWHGPIHKRYTPRPMGRILLLH